MFRYALTRETFWNFTQLPVISSASLLLGIPGDIWSFEDFLEYPLNQGNCQPLVSKRRGEANFRKDKLQRGDGLTVDFLCGYGSEPNEARRVMNDLCCCLAADLSAAIEFWLLSLMLCELMRSKLWNFRQNFWNFWRLRNQFLIKFLEIFFVNLLNFSDRLLVFSTIFRSSWKCENCSYCPCFFRVDKLHWP